MKSLLLILALCGSAYAQTYQSGYISRANADRRYVSAIAEDSAVGPLHVASTTISASSVTLLGAVNVVNSGVGIGEVPANGQGLEITHTGGNGLEITRGTKKLSFSANYAGADGYSPITTTAGMDLSHLDGSNVVWNSSYADGFDILTDGFSVGGSTLVVQNGRVGVGAASPLVSGRSSNDSIISAKGVGTSAGVGVLELSRGGGATGESTLGELAFVNFGDTIGSIKGISNDLDSGYIQFLTQNDGGAETERMRIAKDGFVSIGAVTPTVALDINSDAFRVRTSSTIVTATDTCSAGTIRWDADYVYVCVAANTWKRVGIATWP